MPRRLLLSTLIWSALAFAGAAAGQSSGSGTVHGASAVNVRSGPGLEHASSGQLRRGAIVRIDEIDGNWARVRYADGEGWVYARFIAEHTPAPASPTPTPGASATDGEIAPDSSDDELAPAPPVEAVLPEEVRGEIDRILTLTESIHHELERQRNSPPGPAAGGASVGLRIGLLGIGVMIGVVIGLWLARQQERSGRSRVRF